MLVALCSYHEYSCSVGKFYHVVHNEASCSLARRISVLSPLDSLIAHEAKHGKMLNGENSPA